METNTLELLPKCLTYKGNVYFLRVWINAWNELCIGYNGHHTIMCYVVQKGRSKYVPEIIEQNKTSGLNEHIGNDETLNKCITHIIVKINKMVENNEIIAEY